jgi:hypothetical protein
LTPFAAQRIRPPIRFSSYAITLKTLVVWLAVGEVSYENLRLDTNHIFSRIVFHPRFHHLAVQPNTQSQIDDNIINATNSILALLEKAKTLNPRERRLLVDWLNDWEYFEPPRVFKKYRPIATDATIKALKQYFNELAADDQ